MCLAPFRCLDCRIRFFRLSIPSLRRGVEPALEPVVLSVPSELTDAPPPESPPLPSSEPSRSILVLDSDPAIRKLLRRLLERSGYFITELAEPKELLSELRSRHVDLLIADFGLPRQQERQALAALWRAHPDLKIVELSSQPLDTNAVPSWLALQKPFHAEALLESVHHLLAQTTPEIGLGHAAP
jgi:CheY-like chemotaxis protein